MLVTIDGLLFAIPFRHHIAHKYCFNTVGDAGLDYTKAVVISKPEYIGKSAYIDGTEYAKLKGRDAMIESGMRRYLKTYRKALRYRTNPHYQQIISCSALQYFIKK